MKERLDQYTMAQFINIACGDYTAIGSDSDKAKGVAARLITQFNEVSDPTSARAKVLGEEQSSRCDARIKLYKILLNIILVYDEYDEVRSILKEAGKSDLIADEDEMMTQRIEQALHREEFKYKRLRKEHEESAIAGIQTEADVRASFDKQTAALMSHFKFSINHEAISASVYANLVSMFVRQQRQQSAVKK